MPEIVNKIYIIVHILGKYDTGGFCHIFRTIIKPNERSSKKGRTSLIHQ